MQVISRTQNESVVIGDDLIVTVLEISDDEVRIAIEYRDGAPLPATLGIPQGESEPRRVPR